MGHDAGWECGTGWGSRVEWDEVRSGEDGSSERTVQQRAMDEHGSRRNFLERDRET
jgi:hypothetical protein